MKVRLLWLCLAVATLACPDKKTEPAPVAKVEVKPPAPPPPPPPVAEPRAEKECAAPIDPGPPMERDFGGRTGTLAGAKLTFTGADADQKLTFGVLGPLNEDSGTNMVAIKKYLKFFADNKADAIIVAGDVGELASGIKRVLVELAKSKLLVFVIAGNSECRAEYSDGVTAAMDEAPNIVNMNQVRVVEMPELTLVSLPGYHDPAFIKCATGCRYFQSTLDEVARVAKEAKTPVALISHGPPRGQGGTALDFVSGNQNVGDEGVAKLLSSSPINFGFFTNIKEAGARAVSDVAGTTLVKEGDASEKLFINPGPADATTAWDMNDGTKGVGFAAVVTIDAEKKASYKLLRLKPPTAAEKAEAKRLEPPAATP